MTPDPRALVAQEIGRGIVLARQAFLRAVSDPSFVEYALARFEAGAREHGDSWIDWPDRRFEAEMAEEAADLANYATMRAVAAVLRERRG